MIIIYVVNHIHDCLTTLSKCIYYTYSCSAFVQGITGNARYNSVTAPMHNSTIGHFLFLNLIRIAVHMVGIIITAAWRQKWLVAVQILHDKLMAMENAVWLAI